MDQVEWAYCFVDGVGSECLKNYISQERTLSFTDTRLNLLKLEPKLTPKPNLVYFTIPISVFCSGFMNHENEAEGIFAGKNDDGVNVGVK